ncbi:RNA cytidine acetyltransferase [Portunus trituberculatus]|uniref:RNA cytidine acetyltransferase n=1 Tax=Portunus trituberculatus TaxID=210409 RepID=A0A5B7JBZ4_PORTR|nr:RNA cytidine acetyltransferase [Portunus trituberculatus]
MIMLKVLGEDKEARTQSWLADLWFDFRKRVMNLLPAAFKGFDCKFALNLLTNNIYKKTREALSMMELKLHCTPGDLQRLEEFVHHQCEAAFIVDILPTLAHLYFLRKIKDFKLKPVKAVSIASVLYCFSC